jgi:hypothetical protein
MFLFLKGNLSCIMFKNKNTLVYLDVCYYLELISWSLESVFNVKHLFVSKNLRSTKKRSIK